MPMRIESYSSSPVKRLSYAHIFITMEESKAFRDYRPLPSSRSKAKQDGRGACPGLDPESAERGGEGSLPQLLALAIVPTKGPSSALPGTFSHPASLSLREARAKAIILNSFARSRPRKWARKGERCVNPIAVKREKRGPAAKRWGDEGNLTSFPSSIPLLRNGACPAASRRSKARPLPQAGEGVRN